MLILGEEDCTSYRPSEGSVLLRIKATPFLPLQHADKYEEILAITFDDVERDNEGKVISADQARQVVEFFDRHRGKKMVIHCKMGRSRSSAAACAWAYLNGDTDAEEAIRASFYPNPRVYQELLTEIDRQERKGWK